MDETKNCSNPKCSQVNPQLLSAFNKSGTSKDGLRSQCLSCHATYRKENKEAIARRNAAHYQDNKQTIRIRQAAYHLFRRYGLTPTEKLNLTPPDGLCALSACLSPATDIDHCHTTGKVRGMPCNPCNSGMGQLNDDPKNLVRAAHYLLPENNLNWPIDRNRELTIKETDGNFKRRTNLRNRIPHYPRRIRLDGLHSKQLLPLLPPNRSPHPTPPKSIIAMIRMLYEDCYTVIVIVE